MKPKYRWQIDSCQPLYLLYIFFSSQYFQRCPDHHRLAIWRWGERKKNASDMRMKPFKWTSGCFKNTRRRRELLTPLVSTGYSAAGGRSLQSKRSVSWERREFITSAVAAEKKFKIWASSLTKVSQVDTACLFLFCFFPCSFLDRLFRDKGNISSSSHTAALQDPTMHLSWLSDAAAPVWGGHGRSLGCEAAATNRSSEEEKKK